MSYDPTQNAARLTLLQNRCRTTYPTQGGGFTLASAATTRLAGDHPYQLWLRASPTGPRTIVAWTAVYRATLLRGRFIVVDADLQPLGEAATLQDALDAFDLLDQRILRQGGGSGPFGVQTGVNVPRPYYDPTLTGDARWVNAPTQGFR